MLLPLLLLAAGCSSVQMFTPREAVNGTAASGVPAALYPLGDAQGRRGEVRVWSDGAREVKDQQDIRVHIGFEIENLSDQPLQLEADSVRLRRLVVDGVPRDGELAPEQSIGSTEAAPGQTTRVDCWFDPGPGVAPRSVDGFDLHWRVKRADGSMAWEQVTPFGEWAPRSYWDADPWVYGYWGYGPWGYPYRPWYGHRHW